MCLCMCVCVDMCVHVCACVRVCVLRGGGLGVGGLVCVCVCLRAYLCVRACVCARMWLCVCLCVVRRKLAATSFPLGCLHLFSCFLSINPSMLGSPALNAGYSSDYAWRPSAERWNSLSAVLSTVCTICQLLITCMYTATLLTHRCDARMLRRLA